MNQYRTVLPIAMLVTYALCVGRASAEISTLIPGSFGWKKSVPLHLVVEARVIEDLDLDPDKAAALKSLHDRIMSEYEAERKLPASAAIVKPTLSHGVQRAKWDDNLLHAIRKRHASEIDAILTPDQQNRLYQLHLQMQGFNARLLSDPAVAAELDLTAHQCDQIYQIHWRAQRAEMDLVKKGRSYTGPFYGDLVKEAPDKVMRVLTEAQRQKFETLAGKPLRSE